MTHLEQDNLANLKYKSYKMQRSNPIRPRQNSGLLRKGSNSRIGSGIRTGSQQKRSQDRSSALGQAGKQIISKDPSSAHPKNSIPKPSQPSLKKQQQRPPLQMMPSMRQKYANKQATKVRKENWIPRGLVTEIALFSCGRIKQALKLMEVCKKFHEQLVNNMRFWYLICLAWCPKETFAVVKDMKQIQVGVTLNDLDQQQDTFLRRFPHAAQHDWRQTTIKSVLTRDKALQGKVMKEFQKAFQDSFTRQQYDLKRIVNKFQMQFTLIVNRQDRHFFKTNDILFNPHSLNFDLMIGDGKLTFSSLRSLTLKAFLMKQKFVRIVLDLLDPKQKQKHSRLQSARNQGGIQLYQFQVAQNSSLIVGTFDDGETICFLSFHLLYIDILMQMTGLKEVYQDKFCDIDSQFGLHDWTVLIDLHNSQTSFISESYTKVFTKNVDAKWAYFTFDVSDGHIQFKGNLFYEWKSLIFSEKVDDLAILDLVIQDEFGEPFFFTCVPVEHIKGKQLFRDEVRFDNSEVSVGSVVFQSDKKSGADVELMIQLKYIPAKNKTIVTHLELRLATKSIQAKLKGSLPQFR